MPKVTPFNGLLYNPEKVSGNDVIAPPYDIISPEQKERLYARSPYNVVRIDFGKDLPGDKEGNDRYSRANDLLNQWIAEQILVKDSEPAYYAYEVEYALNSEKRTLRGIFALVEVVELGRGVWPHEETRPKAKADRLEIMRQCMSNLSPIYAIYNSPEKTTAKILQEIKGRPFIEGIDADAAAHRLYRISDPAAVSAISAELDDRPLFIADGHHRYEVALEFKKEMDAKTDRTDGAPKPWDYVLIFLAEMSDSGITILPTHRMIKGISPKGVLTARLAADFEINPLPAGTDVNAAILAGGRHTFGMYLKEDRTWYLLKYRGTPVDGVHAALKDLDVVILRELILNREYSITELAYEMSIDVAVGKTEAGEFDAVFALYPTDASDIERVASENLRMPAKSTYFYPKLMTGMVINKF